MSLTSAIGKLCGERGWDVGELSRRTGVSRAHIWALMRGRYRGTRDNPVLETIERLAWALKVSEAEIISVYPELVDLNKAIELPFEHYVRLRDIRIDERPASVRALLDRYNFQKVFWEEPTGAAPLRQKRRKTPGGG
jgi:transcriptional regulator with XRE-family HTH domain